MVKSNMSYVILYRITIKYTTVQYGTLENMINKALGTLLNAYKKY